MRFAPYRICNLPIKAGALTNRCFIDASLRFKWKTKASDVVANLRVVGVEGITERLCEYSFSCVCFSLLAKGFRF